MILTTEKAEKFTEYLTDNVERAKKLFALPLSVVVNEIRLDGLDYTEEELREYVDYIQTSLSAKNTEFNESKLDEVSGGFATKSNLVMLTTILNEDICKWIL